MERYIGKEIGNKRQVLNKNVDKVLDVLTARCSGKDILPALSKQEKGYGMSEDKAHLSLLKPTKEKERLPTLETTNKELPREMMREMMRAELVTSNDPYKMWLGQELEELSEENRRLKQEVKFTNKSIEKDSPLATPIENSILLEEKREAIELLKTPGADRQPSKLQPPPPGLVLKKRPRSEHQPERQSVEPVRWRPFITAYQPKELRALKFQSREYLRRAIDKCFDDPALIDMPLDYADGLTMIVPDAAVTLFKGLEFEVYTVR